MSSYSENKNAAFGVNTTIWSPSISQPSEWTPHFGVLLFPFLRWISSAIHHSLLPYGYIHSRKAIRSSPFVLFGRPSLPRNNI